MSVIRTFERRLAFAVAAWIGLAAAGSSLRGETKPAARNDIPYSTEVATPHVPWAKRLPGGPIRGFFVPSVRRAATWSS